VQFNKEEPVQSTDEVKLKDEEPVQSIDEVKLKDEGPVQSAEEVKLKDEEPVQSTDEVKLKDEEPVQSTDEVKLKDEEPVQSIDEVKLKDDSLEAFIEEDLVYFSLDTVKVFIDGVLTSVTELQQFDGKFLILTLNVLSKEYQTINKELTLSYSKILCEKFFKNISNINSFPDHFLTQFGFLKVSFLNYLNNFFFIFQIYIF